MDSETVVVNLRKTMHDVYIGRAPGIRGILGNPHVVDGGGKKVCTHCRDKGALKVFHARGEAVELYRQEFPHKMATNLEFRRAVLACRGRKLGCFCKPLPCHGDVIKEWLDAHPDVRV